MSSMDFNSSHLSFVDLNIDFKIAGSLELAVRKGTMIMICNFDGNANLICNNIETCWQLVPITAAVDEKETSMSKFM